MTAFLHLNSTALTGFQAFIQTFIRLLRCFITQSQAVCFHRAVLN